jgi:hypothetical protein
VKALPAEQQKAASTAHEGVRRIDALYTIEREAKSLEPQYRQQLREHKSRPLLESLYAWCAPQLIGTAADQSIAETVCDSYGMMPPF